MNTEIQNVTEEYATDHYDRSTLHNIPKSKIELSIPDKLFLDFMLMKIRSKADDDELMLNVLRCHLTY